MIQQAIKLGDKPTQTHLIDQILKESFEEIIKSKYGRFLAKKCIKYGNKEQKTKIFKVLLDNLYQFIAHVEASGVLDYFLKHYSTPH